MSYTSMYPFRVDGGISGDLPDYEFRNSHGSASFIWSALWRMRVLKVHPNNSDHPRVFSYMGYAGDNGEDKVLWTLSNRKELPEFERAALLMSFDWAMLQRKNFERMAADLELFAEVYRHPTATCSLSDQARTLRGFLEMPEDEVAAVSWNQTSVNSALWITYVEPEDPEDPEEHAEGEYVWYNWKIGKQHFWIYEDVDRVTALRESLPSLTEAA